MTKPTANLVDAARSTRLTAEQALTWFDHNSDRIKHERPALLKEFRRFGRVAERLSVAAGRPMCVGVFGPSQAGKSYLISALARRGVAPLVARFDGVPEGLDFVRHINPEGGQESTGLVTRFSIRSISTPPGFPIALRLLSQSDLVNILANTYFFDCDRSAEEPLTAAALESVLSAAEAALGREARGGLDADAIRDIQDYAERQFRGEAALKALSAADYWDRAAELCPRLDAAGRAALLAPLWGFLEQFTRLFETLAAALSALGDPESAFCPLEALVNLGEAGIERRTDSIIDVNTLKGLAQPDAESLMVAAGGGRTAKLTRPVVTALVAELHVATSEKAWDFFDHTDLLDFPGARSRENIPDVRRFLGQPGALESLFLRGKVAFLFDRYCAEQELTAMLLCIGPSNQEVRTLPAIVKGWIDISHGPDPEARARNQTALFLLLTKFDAEFAEAAGQAEDSTQRWTTRLNSSFLDFFGKSHDWPQRWTPGEPFNNLFWLRNPNFKSKHILEYDADGAEIGIRTSETARIARYRQEFIDNPQVGRHFADPARAWDEAFRLNDGGIGFLAASLAPVCNPEIKLRQISERLRLLNDQMVERLERHFVSDDLSKRRETRRAAAVAIARHLARCAEAQRFGQLVRALQVDQNDLADVFLGLEARGNGHDGLFGRVVDAGELLAGLGIEADASQTARPRDRADIYADAVMLHWIEAARAVAETPGLCRYFQMPGPVMAEFIDEMVAGAQRLQVKDALATQLRPAVETRQPLHDVVAKLGLISANEVNRYVMWMGFDGLPEASRPIRPKTRRPIFAEEPDGDALALDPLPARFDQQFYEDWLRGFLVLVDDNASSLGGQSVNLEQNARLGGLIESLRAAA